MFDSMTVFEKALAILRITGKGDAVAAEVRELRDKFVEIRAEAAAKADAVEAELNEFLAELES